MGIVYDGEGKIRELDSESRRKSPVTPSKQCALCHQPMDCNPQGPCWCKEIPNQYQVPTKDEGIGCLCGGCLKTFDKGTKRPMQTTADPHGLPVVTTKTSSDNFLNVTQTYLKSRIMIERFFTKDLPNHDPYAGITWVTADACIKKANGETAFEQKGMEFPDYFSQTAINIAAQHYFKGRLGTQERESSLRQVINRIVNTMTAWGNSQGYFLSEVEGEVFHDELTYILVHQMAAFNSPVWYNVGVKQKCQGFCNDYETGETREIKEGELRPQGSACFILQVDDNLKSILNWNTEEGMIFKYGSGAGVNISKIRSKKEYLRGGGKPSGPMSFAKGADTWAGAIKSGGKTRRAAKMLIMDVDHPDIEEFIFTKSLEEKKAQALIGAGYSSEFNSEGGAYDSIAFQNANNSVRVTDEFMRLAERGENYNTLARMDGSKMEERDAGKTLEQIARATWECGDPGMQFDTTINRWNTCADTERIWASNPCSEYMFLNNTACNLASQNLLKYFERREEKPYFNRESFQQSVYVIAFAQELLVGNAGYPTEAIANRSNKYRTLGQGYANLGSLLMHWGVPYDSEDGRNVAASVTSLQTALVYRMSAELAERKGPFPEFQANKRSVARVMKLHMDEAYVLDGRDLFNTVEIWQENFNKSLSVGIRNAQATVLAPTGTIGFLMDCDTTGIEPDLALVKYKKLVGGGELKLVNTGIRSALQNMNYSESDVAKIETYVYEKGTVEGCPQIKPAHVAVFDCSFPAFGFKRIIHYDGHLKMMAAVQPFVSGAISKTVNMPASSTEEDIKQAYLKAWRLKLKAVAIYRDGCKQSQPLSTKMAEAAAKPKQRKMPATRNAKVHEFTVGGQKVYLTVGMYEDGSPGEIFIDLSKEGSTLSGVFGAFAIAVSFALQHGVPIDTFVRKFSHMKFEPAGYTGTNLGYASSIPDYVFRWLDQEFGEKSDDQEEQKTKTKQGPKGQNEPERLQRDVPTETDAPACNGCGDVMTRNGSCFKCANCGTTSGCS